MKTFTIHIPKYKTCLVIKNNSICSKTRMENNSVLKLLTNGFYKFLGRFSGI